MSIISLSERMEERKEKERKASPLNKIVYLQLEFIFTLAYYQIHYSLHFYFPTADQIIFHVLF
jgi:hypothetical protein